MCSISGMMQDIAEYEARKFTKTNPSLDYDDLLSEGLRRILDRGKANQGKSYYKKIAFHAILDYIKLEKKKGIVTSNHGGDRKSPEFKQQQELTGNIQVCSLDGLLNDLSDTGDRFPKKTAIPPNYDNVDYDQFQSSSDSLTEYFLRGRI